MPSNKKKILNQNTFLFLQVFQTGALQIEKKVKIDSLLMKKIKIGDKPKCDLFIPYARTLLEMVLFKIGRNKVDIILDPRLEGFLSTGNKFGNFKDFTSPRGSLLQLTSIEDPLAVSLDYGSRGKIQFNGFDITFKIEKENTIKYSPKVQGLERNIFQMPEYDVPIERKVIPISILATGLAFIPIIFWLLKAPLVPFAGIINLPDEIAIKIISPENIRLLPFVYKTKYDGNDNKKLAIFWIFELMKRWENAEIGKSSESVIPFLQNAHDYVDNSSKIENWEKTIYENNKNLEIQRTAKDADRYFSFLKTYPSISSSVSGLNGGSQYSVLLKRIDQLQKTDQAIIEYLDEEHIILKEFYAEKYKARKLGIVDPPSTGQVIGPQPDKSFITEFKNFKDAEREAAIAEESEYRKKMLEKYKFDKNNKNSIIWISQNSLIIPSDYRKKNDNFNFDLQYNNLMHNAYYSVGIFKIPPLPPPKATIDTQMVDFVIFNKKEEIRSCYNSAIRKHPGLQGTMTISWKILESGKAADVSVVESSIFDKNLIACLESRLLVWNFPKPKNGFVTVTYPFQFIITKNK
ncbi:AgmX/PglI C-terminal domain-containing protein [Pigmentibacter sp. JX0631]|uniref:AgmX/PglI C-terminal domain-containing protein n=1 Tax=Pigmentibacter sp. JX0631 TaxID=2976982 RepID=UPI002468D501|nr:AgmX/PglI C-terminal domain-containing protein [Pigmentibacter sp. JX0631]WGL61254.1 AgmX/PglI C-terminal domain-containing protein [Pigmentibacter sp. JX0631]